mmetsp:Transcript_35267/g.69586  ORF Transcript_35267/g.69586 Transcript_35267/m.69586 type:complete len:229 (-) Transcript_35267:335-1021(-)
MHAACTARGPDESAFQSHSLKFPMLRSLRPWIAGSGRQITHAILKKTHSRPVERPATHRLQDRHFRLIQELKKGTLGRPSAGMMQPWERRGPSAHWLFSERMHFLLPTSIPWCVLPGWAIMIPGCLIGIICVLFFFFFFFALSAPLFAFLLLLFSFIFISFYIPVPSTVFLSCCLLSFLLSRSITSLVQHPLLRDNAGSHSALPFPVLLPIPLSFPMLTVIALMHLEV